MKTRLAALFLFASLIFFAFCGTAWAGYSTTQLTNNSYYDHGPQINDSGQVIWVENSPPWWNEYYGILFPGDFSIVRYSGGINNWIWGCWGCNSGYGDHPDPVFKMNDTGQVVWQYGGTIYLCSGGVTNQIAENQNEYMSLPQINDSGQVVWAGLDGNNWGIILYSGGVTAKLSNSYDIDPQINDSGQVVWAGYDGSDYEIYFYSGGVTTKLSDNSYDDNGPQINSSGQVVWYGNGEIFLYSGGVTTKLTDNSYDDNGPQINSSGQVVWAGLDGSDSEIYFYSGGVTTKLSDNSYDDYGPQINSSGQVVWYGSGEIFLNSGGVTTKFTDNNYYDYDPQINDSGQVVWAGLLDGSDFEIYLASPSGCSGEKPLLVLSRSGVSWASYADYLTGELSVNMMVSNPGTVSVSQVQIIGSINTGGVTLSTAVPASIGDIAGGTSSPVTLTYHVPGGVVSFNTTVFATAQDSCGTTYGYPGPYPGT